MDLDLLLADFAAPSRPPVRIGWRPNIQPCWEFDLGAIERACELLGVTRPVEIGAVNARRRWSGMRHDEGDQHRVTVANWHTPEGASRTIWHELSHAAQSDRGVEGGTSQLRGREYDDDPREREARACERNHEAVGSLVIARVWADGAPE